MLTNFINYLRDEDGQTSTEYILLVAVVAMIVLKFKTQLSAKLEGVMNSVFQNVDEKISSDL